MGLSLGRYRVSSLAFAPGTEKQVQMQCTRVSEQLPKRRNQTVSKAVGGRRAGTQEREVGVGVGGVPRVGAGRGEEEVKGTLSVGDARPWAGMRGKWGIPGLVGCLEWASGAGRGKGVGGTAGWATLGAPRPWAGWEGDAWTGGVPGVEVRLGGGLGHPPDGRRWALPASGQAGVRGRGRPGGGAGQAGAA